MPHPDPARSAARLALFERYRERGATVWIGASGTSMGRAVPSGSSLLVEFGASEPRVGEIVVARCGGSLMSHRVVSRRETTAGLVLTTKGDARRYFDPPVPASDVLGVVRGMRRASGGRVERGTCHGPRAVAAACLSKASGLLRARVSATTIGRLSSRFGA
ncbi:MAG TPA: S24/S26 family peptidase [Gaiellaceae bacterium]